MEEDWQGQCASHLFAQYGTNCSEFDRISIVSRSGKNLWVQQPGSSDIQIIAMSALVYVVIILSMLIILYAHWHFLEWRRRKLLPPGPWPRPIVGNLFDMAGKDGLPHRALRSLAARFGGLMYLRLGSHPCIVVSTTAVVKEVIQTNDKDFLSRPHSLFWTFSSGSIGGAPEGPYWRHLRKLCNTELFSNTRQASYNGIRTEEICDMVRGLLEDSKKGTAMTLTPRLYGMAANNLTRMATNKRYFGAGTKDEQEKEDLERLIERQVTLTSKFIISDYVPWLSFVPKLQGHHSVLKEFSNFRQAATDRIFEVEKHRERAKERQQRCNEDHSKHELINHVPDFVDLLLASAGDHGKPLSDQELIALLTDMIVGVTDTASSTIEWAMAELILQPDVMKQAQHELDTVVGTDRLVQESDIPNLPYLQAITKEVFRMHPVAPLSLPHISTRACEVLGFKLPPCTWLIFNVFAIQRDPSVYENPDTFDVNRFMVDRHCNVDAVAAFDSYELMPFGAGRRMCPASAFGNRLVSMVIAHLLHSFDWTLPEGGQTTQDVDMNERFGTILLMKTPLSLVAKPRSPAFLY